MPISRSEEWISVAELDAHDQIRFTKEFQSLMSEIGWEAKAFVGHLLGSWYDPFEHMLDYSSGEASFSRDQAGTFDRNALDETQDVVEYWAVEWSKHDSFYNPPHQAGTGLKLGVDWYRDMLRAKLVSLRLPKRLLFEYKEKLLEQIAESEATLKKDVPGKTVPAPSPGVETPG
ncbi:MAG: hypothetical protein HYZ49_16395 [Chloroflexi bacterium]|nr:hypothetical protein [Chloroflexota bacterium]